MNPVRQFEQGNKVKVRTNAADECIAQIVKVDAEGGSATVKVLKVTSGSFFKVGKRRTVSLSSISHLLNQKQLRHLVKTRLIEIARTLTTHESVEFMGNLEQEEVTTLEEEVIATIRQGFRKRP